MLCKRRCSVSIFMSLNNSRFLTTFSIPLTKAPKPSVIPKIYNNGIIKVPLTVFSSVYIFNMKFVGNS